LAFGGTADRAGLLNLICGGGAGDEGFNWTAIRKSLKARSHFRCVRQPEK
jgi:hypothetical protein